MSVELQKLRGEIMREALSKGWTKPSDVAAPWPTMVEAQRLDRWFRRLYTPMDAPLVGGGRLVNHFMLGADPEFVFHDGQKRRDARLMNLKAGPAFGADNNGRLVELRAHPSRHALEVLASLWLAMRWMDVWVPETMKLSWRSGAYFESDGLGGHIHFGRKRTKLRDREIAVLDRLAHLMFTAGIFDREEGRLRVRQAQGAPNGHPYGALSDVRKQPHGYEYRTLPSWVDSPWLAYFTLVASKLVVAFPESVLPLSEADASLSADVARNQLRFLLAYYAPLDDDARLAFAILSRQGFPQHAAGTDLKVSWGIFSSLPFGGQAEVKTPDVLPVTVPPRPEDLKELADAMYIGRVPELIPLTPTWTPNTLPEGYTHWINLVDTKVAPNLGELAMDYCIHKKLPFSLHNPGGLGHDFLWRFPGNVSRALERAEFARNFPSGTWDCGAEERTLYMNCSKEVPFGRIKAMFQAACDVGALPIWRIEAVRPESFTEWKPVPEPAKKPKLPGKFLIRDLY